MESYYVNKNARNNGDHEVHNLSCDFLPDPLNRRSLGVFATCIDAVNEARRTYHDAKGCCFCCVACHTQV